MSGFVTEYFECSMDKSASWRAVNGRGGEHIPTVLFPRKLSLSGEECSGLQRIGGIHARDEYLRSFAVRKSGRCNSEPFHLTIDATTDLGKLLVTASSPHEGSL